MELLKSIYQRKGITAFFTISFVIVIFTFSIGNSIFISQREMLKENDPRRNVCIRFHNYNDITLNDVINALKEEDIGFEIVLGGVELSIETFKIEGNKELLLDMKEGKRFTNKELLSSQKGALYSSKLPNKVNIPIDENREIPLEKVGSFYTMDRNVIISLGYYQELYGRLQANNPSVSIMLKGDPEKIAKSINNLNSKFKNKSIDGNIEITKIENKVDNQAAYVYIAAISVFIITIINSTNISALWTRRREKEIVLRKVFGAQNKDIYKIFFGELLIIATIALIVALLIQILISILANGFIGNIDLRINIVVFITSAFISILVAFLVSLTTLKHIEKIQPAEMLKED